MIKSYRAPPPVRGGDRGGLRGHQHQGDRHPGGPAGRRNRSATRRPGDVPGRDPAERILFRSLRSHPAGLVPATWAVDRGTHLRVPSRPGPPWTGHRPRCPSRTARSLPNWPGRWRPSSPGGGARTIQIGPPGEPVARITSDAGAFLLWVSQRATPEEAGAEMSGDAGQLTIARKLRVF
jgi:hypothetical protein